MAAALAHRDLFHEPLGQPAEFVIGQEAVARPAAVHPVEPA